MNKNDILIMLDNGHGIETSGKRSPVFEDGVTQLREYAYCREIVNRIAQRLNSEGFMCYIVTPEENDVPLSRRVARVNAKHKEMRTQGKTSLLISVHNNAAANGGWANATGWAVYLSPNASLNSKNLAGYLADATSGLDLKLRKPEPKQKYWVQNLYICKSTNCPAVLTENFFMDNRSDCEYLLSEKGKNDVVEIHVRGIKEYIENL